MQPKIDSVRDDITFSLSDAQLEVFDGWRRPNEALTDSTVTDGATKSSCIPTMVANDIVDLVQDVTTDCSVVASLCAGTARAERGHPKVGLCPSRHVCAL